MAENNWCNGYVRGSDDWEVGGVMMRKCDEEMSEEVKIGRFVEL